MCGPPMARGISVCNFEHEFYIEKVILGGEGGNCLPRLQNGIRHSYLSFNPLNKDCIKIFWTLPLGACVL